MKVSLFCFLCKKNNYWLNKSIDSRLILKKFCKFCNQKTIHKEEK